MARPGTSSSPDLPKVVCESQRAGQAEGRVPLGRLMLPLEEASRGKPRRDGLRPRHGVFIGDQVARWNSVKANLSVRSDEEMAKMLLDVFIEKRMNQPGPSRAVREAGLDEGAAVTCDSVKDDNDDLDSFLSLSLSAGSESTVTLSHPSSMFPDVTFSPRSIGSFEDDTDVDLYSGADSVSGSNSKSPGMASRRPEHLPLPNHEMKVEQEEWESGSESHRFERCNSKNREADRSNAEMDPTVPTNTLPEEAERQRASDGEILQVCIGEGGVPTCPAIKKEQEEPCSVPSPVASAGSESTVTLSHPSSDISFEEDCLVGAAVVSESETEGPETNRRKRPALPDSEGKGREPRWDQPGMLDIGEEIDRWNFLKDYLKLKSDEEMARALLDLYTETHAATSSPLTPPSAFVKKV
uniref:uncharacterized protein isoform X2 n=1 Tax=Pristiophorus japonicus TaxID=55135 RepID=UPI00398E42BA